MDAPQAIAEFLLWPSRQIHSPCTTAKSTPTLLHTLECPPNVAAEKQPGRSCQGKPLLVLSNRITPDMIFVWPSSSPGDLALKAMPIATHSSPESLIKARMASSLHFHNGSTMVFLILKRRLTTSQRIQNKERTTEICTAKLKIA